MLIQKKSLANTLLIALIIIIAGLLFLLFEKINEKKYELLDAIPTSSVLFIQLNSIDQFYQNLEQSNLWSNLLALPDFSEFKHQAHQFDSVLHLNNRIKNLIAKQEAVIAVHPFHKNLELLIVIDLQGNQKRKFFRTIFTQIYGETFTTLKSVENGNQLNKLVFNQYEESFTYAVHGGLFIGSSNGELVSEAIKQLETTPKINNNLLFTEVANTAGKKVDANIFINYRQLPAFFNLVANAHFNTLNESGQKSTNAKNTQQKLNDTLIHQATSEISISQNMGELNALSDIADWSGLDLIIKKDEFVLSGFTSANDTTNKFVNRFKNQAPQAFEMASVIPAKTTLIHHFGIENIKSYFSKQHPFIPYIGSEFAFVSMATNSKNYKNESYAIIKINNIADSQAYLNQMAKNHKGSGTVKNYREYSINHIINTERFVPILFGNPFKIVQEFYYAFINNYLIVGNSAYSIERFIGFYLNGKTLASDPDYLSFSDNIAEKSNYYFYFNIKKGLNLLEQFSNQKVYNYLVRHAFTFKNYQAIGLQYSNQQNGLFTNLYINYDPNILVKNDGLWQARLDAKMSGKPLLVNTHLNQYLYTIVSDVEDQVYLFDQEGNRLWKHKINGPILSKIHEVDYFKNGKTQYLFNTKNTLYLLDVLGHKVGDYPHKLQIPAANGISLFDYSNDRNYRIIYAGTDQKIYNYNIEAKKVAGWNLSQTKNLVESEIQHLVANNRDYILLADVHGTVRILNRLGKDRILLKTQFNKAKSSKFYVNSTNQKSLFITTNISGKLTYISSNGNLEYSDFGEYSANHFFLYEDFDHDGNNDFIYIDGESLKIFNRFKQEIFQYQFNSEIISPPLIYNGSDGTKILGIYSMADQEVFLFNKNGEIEIPQSLEGSTPFALGDILKNGSVNLLMGSDNTFNNYLIK